MPSKMFHENPVFVAWRRAFTDRGFTLLMVHTPGPGWRVFNVYGPKPEVGEPRSHGQIVVRDVDGKTIETFMGPCDAGDNAARDAEFHMNVENALARADGLEAALASKH